MRWIKGISYLMLMGGAYWFFVRVNGIYLVYLWERPSFLFLLAGWGFTFVNYSFLEVYQAFAQGLGYLPRSQSLQLSHQIVGSFAKNGLLASGVALLLGVFYALANIGDVAALGNALALSLLPLIWALSVYTLGLYPLQIALQRQHLEEEFYDA